MILRPPWIEKAPETVEGGKPAKGLHNTFLKADTGVFSAIGLSWFLKNIDGKTIEYQIEAPETVEGTDQLMIPLDSLILLVPNRDGFIYAG